MLAGALIGQQGAQQVQGVGPLGLSELDSAGGEFQLPLVARREQQAEGIGERHIRNPAGVGVGRLFFSDHQQYGSGVFVEQSGGFEQAMFEAIAGGGEGGHLAGFIAQDRPQANYRVMHRQAELSRRQRLLVGQIRTGKAHPSILGSVMVPYYGSDTPISQVANITVKDSRTLQVVAFERNMLGAVDKAIQSAGLNLNPTNLGELLLISMPALTEETRKVFAKQARDAAEDARIAVRNIRRDALSQLKDLVKEKEISEDEERRAADDIQKLTDKAVADIEVATKQKEADLMAV